jgi:hypothetical protein
MYFRSTKDYRAALVRVLAIHERELARRSELGELRRDLYAKGVLNKDEYDEGEQALTTAKANVTDTRRAIDEADRMLKEAEEVIRLSK